MFSTQGTEEKVRESKYLRPGVHDAIIANIEGVTPESGSPYIKLDIHKANATAEFSTEVRFYMTDKGQQKSLQKIFHLATRIVKASDINAVTAENLAEYGTKLNALLSGKSVRLKFIGEEYLNASQEVKVKTTLGLPPFAEANTEGAEHPVVSLENTKLVYDPTNQYDYKKLPTSNVPVGGESTGSIGW